MYLYVDQIVIQAPIAKRASAQVIFNSPMSLVACVPEGVWLYEPLCHDALVPPSGNMQMHREARVRPEVLGEENEHFMVLTPA